MKRILVVGAGLAGLTTARRLTGTGHRVQVVEASDRVGGQLQTVSWHDRPVDVGAEAMHLAAPPLAALVREAGLWDSVVGSEAGSSWLATPRGLRPLPAGVGPTGPTQIAPVLQAGVLGPMELARAGLEPLMARRGWTGDFSVGDFTTQRFGRAVTEAFVDPLLGNLHAGDVDQLSLRSTAAQLAPIADNRQSILLRKRPPAPPGPKAPMFASWASGLGTLSDTLANGLDLTLRCAVRELRRGPSEWTVVTDEGTGFFDAVVLTVPNPIARELLEPDFPGITEDLAGTPVASVATTVLAYPREAAEHPAFRDGNGVLLRSDSGRLLKAATFLSRKWAHLAHPDLFFIRASAGRAGGDPITALSEAEIVSRLTQDIAEVTGVRIPPVDSLVTYWPDSYPQLVVGHAERMGRVRGRLTGSGVHLAGAAYDGIGMPSTIRSAESAVRAIGPVSGSSSKA